MVIIKGKKFITTKEAAMDYGFSVSWFTLARAMKKGPEYLKMPGVRGRVIYSVEILDKWFEENRRWY